jgi:hypothetical protein
LAPVARTATIYLTVNGNTLPGSLAGNITVTGPTTPTLTLTWNPATSNIEIQPNALNQNATYTVNVTAGVTTTGGLPMTPTSFNFTTLNSTDNIRPAFGGITSITGAGTTQLTLNWTKGTDASGSTSLVYDAYISTTSGFQNFSNPPAMTSPADAATLTLTGLSPNLTYYVMVRARDTSGNQDLNIAEQNQKTLVSFITNIYTPIVSPICAAVCHKPAGVSAFMDLSISSSDVVTNKWVGQPAAATGTGTAVCGGMGLTRVVAGSPSTSLVYRKLTESPPPCGVQMPEGGPYLSVTQTNLFFDWITQGANDN